MTEQTWHQPLIAVDVVALAYNKEQKSLKYALGERNHEPFKGVFALPGVLLDRESAENAAFRALKTKLGVNPESVLYLKDIGVTDNPERDERGPSLSIIYVAVIKDDALDADISKTEVLNQRNHPELPFDHSSILDRAVKYVTDTILVDEELTKALTGRIFKTSDVFNILSGLNGFNPTSTETPDASNLSRKLKSMGWFDKLEKYSSEGRGRPSSAWEYK